MRDKRQVAKLVNLENKQPFVYATGRYSGLHHKTSVAFPIAPGRNGNIIVFDLRYNLDDLLKDAEDTSFYPIVKELSLNKCPAVSPISVLDSETTESFADGREPLVQTGWERLELTRDQVEKNLECLLSHPDFAERMREHFESRPEFPEAFDQESNLYGGFLSRQDENLCNAIRNADEHRLSDFHPNFADERLPSLLLHYKAKNFPNTLSADEIPQWENYRTARLNRQLPSFMKQMEEFQKLLANGVNTTPHGQTIDPFILEELSLWYQNLQG
jgi:exodeoxyribonuclease-1